MNILTTSLSLSLALVAGLSAQNVAVFPADHTTREGSSSTSNRPFSAGISRVQLVYANWRLGIPHGAQINKVGIRPDMAGTGASRQVQLEVWMAHCDNFGTAVSTTFANNYSTPEAIVYDRKIFTLPQVNSVATGPQPTNVMVPLDRPFQYDSSKNLIVEYRIFANNNSNAAFSYASDFAAFFSTTTTIGTACMTSGNRSPAMTAQPAQAGSNWQISLANGPSTSPGVLLFGVSNTLWNGLPLPLSLNAIGATGCNLYVSIDVNVSITTNSSGGFGVGVPVPLERSLYGQWFYVQSALADLFANPAGFVTSRAAGATVGFPPQLTMISATGNASATTGSRSNDYGLVSVFEW